MGLAYFRVFPHNFRHGRVSVFDPLVFKSAMLTIRSVLKRIYLRQKKGVMNMKREEVYLDIEKMFGFVPSFFKVIPDNSLELEWKLMKAVQFDEGPIPNKYRELMGIAISAVTKCRYCTLFHTEAAKLNGATNAEIEDAIHFAKSSAGWSAYLNGYQIDFDQFREEINRAVKYMRTHHGVE